MQPLSNSNTICLWVKYNLMNKGCMVIKNKSLIWMLKWWITLADLTYCILKYIRNCLIQCWTYLKAIYCIDLIFSHFCETKMTPRSEQDASFYFQTMIGCPDLLWCHALTIWQNIRFHKLAESLAMVFTLIIK